MIFFAVLAGIAGMLWETSDLIHENPDHPVISPEASLLNMRYDEFGDPIALSKKAKPLPVAKVWSSPVTRLCVAFIIAIVIGSLFRSLIRGSLALALVVALAFVLVGQDAVLDFFRGQDTGGFLNSSREWFLTRADFASQFLRSSLPSAVVATTGLVMGLMK